MWHIWSLYYPCYLQTHMFYSLKTSSSVLTIFTIGEYLEENFINTTTESLKNLIALKPKTAIVMRNGTEEVVESDEIVVDDIVIAKPGEKIAQDGMIIIGESSIRRVHDNWRICTYR